MLDGPSTLRRKFVDQAKDRMNKYRETELGRAAAASESGPHPVLASISMVAEEFDAIDAVLKRSGKILDDFEASLGKRKSPALERDFFVYVLDWNEDERFSGWRAVFAHTEGLPEILRAAILSDAWNEIEVQQHAPWLGPLFVAAQLRQAGTTQNHLACLNVGLQKIPRELRRARDRIVRLLAVVNAIQEAANTGLKEHDRLVLALEQMQRRLRGRRSSSKLPQLIDLVAGAPAHFYHHDPKGAQGDKAGRPQPGC